MSGDLAKAADVPSSSRAAVNREAIAPNALGVAALSHLLACPACASQGLSFSKRRDTFLCPECDVQFPIFQCGRTQTPWLFADPATTRLEWKARYHGFLHTNSLELERLRKARNVGKCSKTGRQRILRLLQAREQQRNQIVSLLAPLDLDGIAWPADATSLLHGKLPKSQGLSSYISNVFRDWAWNNGENEAQLAAVESVLDAAARSNIGSVLTLGAGACRLPYDLHRRHSPELSVVLDLNPLLLQIASQVTQGNIVSLCEFPVAPLNAESYAVLQECTAPVEIDNFHFLLADAMNPPFVKGGFDTVVTPWLIDIVPQDLRAIMARVNHCLALDGVWVNTGSLAFFHKDETWRYSEEEVLELLELNGFEVLTAERRTMPYLQSPHSSYGRTEKVFSFAARKTKHADVPAVSAYLPNWILDTSLPIPSSTEMAIGSSNHLLKAQVLDKVNGKYTINQIGRILARQYGLGKPETIHAVRRILMEAWEHKGIGSDDY